MTKQNTTDETTSRNRRRVILWLVVPLMLIGLAIQFELDIGGFFEGVFGRGDTASSSQPTPVPLAELFTPEVDHWQEDIIRWAGDFGLDPNLVATVIQIESCGDPSPTSSAGAMGLFQVMPDHFAAGEDPFDTETNARRGLGVLVECLTSTYNPERDSGLAFACYNGGPRVFVNAWANWPQQTRDYYTWGTGIYADAVAQLAASETLTSWLGFGGADLCAGARASLGLSPNPGP